MARGGGLDGVSLPACAGAGTPAETQPMSGENLSGDTNDPYDLNRFVQAQQHDYAQGARRNPERPKEVALDLVHLSAV